jgi:hypothetical protein
LLGSMFILYPHNKSVQHIRQAQQIAVSSILLCISTTLLFQAGYCFTIVCNMQSHGIHEHLKDNLQFEILVLNSEHFFRAVDGNSKR